MITHSLMSSLQTFHSKWNSLNGRSFRMMLLITGTHSPLMTPHGTHFNHLLFLPLHSSPLSSASPSPFLLSISIKSSMSNSNTLEESLSTSMLIELLDSISLSTLIKKLSPFSFMMLLFHLTSISFYPLFNQLKDSISLHLRFIVLSILLILNLLYLMLLEYMELILVPFSLILILHSLFPILNSLLLTSQIPSS